MKAKPVLSPNFTPVDCAGAWANSSCEAFGRKKKQMGTNWEWQNWYICLNGWVNKWLSLNPVKPDIWIVRKKSEGKRARKKIFQIVFRGPTWAKSKKRKKKLHLFLCAAADIYMSKKVFKILIAWNVNQLDFYNSITDFLHKMQINISRQSLYLEIF